MLETVVTIILMPFAIGAIGVTAAIIAGIIKHCRNK